MTTSPRQRMLRAVFVAAATVALTWLAGGQALLGRVDPALALPLLVLPLLLFAWWQRDEATATRRRGYILAIMVLAMVQALLGVVCAGATGGLQLLFVIFAAGVAALLADRLVRWRSRTRFLPWLAGFLLVIGWFVAGHAVLAALYRPAAAVAEPAATMLTGLPLRWSTGGDLTVMISQGAKDDPALIRLEAAGPVLLVDSLVDHVPPQGGALLVAHPRALAPQELVAMDAFVRGGGQAVILADALTAWPAPHPLGDPRNPPITSLLTPLLDHWGVTLGAAPEGDSRVITVDIDGARLRLVSAGRLDRLPRSCRIFADRLVARCPIGAGQAWLVGDADLLFDPLWRPLVPGATHLRQADTMEWLSAALWRGAGHGLLRPLWIRARAD